jgi:large subunit ribosomal protein L29
MTLKKWIKQEKLRDLSLTDLRERVVEQKSKMFSQRLQRVSGKLENYRALPLARRELAVLLTIIREKELAEEAKKS